MHTDKVLEKTLLRKKIYASRKLLMQNPALHAEKSLKIQDTVLSGEAFHTCRILCMYASFKGEVCTKKIAQEAFKTNKTILFPRCHPNITGKMDYVICRSEDDLQLGMYQIPEPKQHCPIFDMAHLNSEKTMIIVPALAFDTQGIRLGYGQGYYDRFMEKTPLATTFGLAFTEHFLPEVPADTWDQAVNFVITEEKMHAIVSN